MVIHIFYMCKHHMFICFLTISSELRRSLGSGMEASIHGFQMVRLDVFGELKKNPWAFDMILHVYGYNIPMENHHFYGKTVVLWDFIVIQWDFIVI